MRIKITDISPVEWRALGIKSYGDPIRIGDATVRVVSGYADRAVRPRGPAGIDYGDSTMEMEVELVP